MQPNEFAKQVNELTNHQWKLLEVLIKANARWITRRQIAQVIGKRRLIPYDIDCLRLLQERSLVDMKKIDDNTPIGYQVVYRASAQTLAALEQINAIKAQQDQTH